MEVAKGFRDQRFGTVRPSSYNASVHCGARPWISGCVSVPTAPLKGREPRGCPSPCEGLVTSAWQRVLGTAPVTTSFLSREVGAALDSSPNLCSWEEQLRASEKPCCSFLAGSGSLIASAHPSPLRFLLLPPALQQEGGLAAPAPVPEGQHRGGSRWKQRLGEHGHRGGYVLGRQGMWRGRGWVENIPWGGIRGVELKGKRFGGHEEQRNK